MAEKNIVTKEQSPFLNNEIENLTKQLAEAYKNNDQELIQKLQNKIDIQLKKDVDKLVKEDLKRKKEYIKENLNEEKIKEQQKVIDDINKRIVALLVENQSMLTPEFKTLKQELRLAISRMECYKNAVYDEKEIERFYKEGILLEEEILGKKFYINRERLIKKLGYVYGGGTKKREDFLTEKEFILDELKTIKEELLSNTGIEIPYTPCVRAKHCIDEFVYYLEKGQVNDCLMNIYEVIESDKNTIYNDRFNKEYKYSSYIGNEEKTIILNMVNRLESYLNNSSSGSPIKRLDFGKTNAIIRETYIDENGRERDRERTIEIPNFSNNNLIDKIDNKLKGINPNYEVSAPLDVDSYNKKEKYNIDELIKKIDEKIEDINNEIAVEISDKIKKLPDNTEFNFQQFMENYDITDNENLINIIENKLQEFDNDKKDSLKNYILDITTKIIDLPNNYETSISQIINYNPENYFVDPLDQGIIYNKVCEVCKDLKINLQSTYDKFGGLAFYYTFIKMQENEVYIKQQQTDFVDTINTSETVADNTPKTYVYEFVPYKQIGPIMLNIDNEKDYTQNISASYLANTRRNFVMCRPIALDHPEILKRRGEDHKIYIKYNNNEIKITCYLKKFIDDLKIICDDFIIDESYSDNQKYFFAYSEKSGIILTGKEEKDQPLIHYLYFNGKDSFIQELNTYKDLTAYNEKNNQ